MVNTTNTQMQNLPIQKILAIKCEDHVKDMYQSHSTFHPGDAGLDLFCPEDLTVSPGDTVKINLYIKCEMIYIYRQCEQNTTHVLERNSSYYLYPRSSIIKTPLRLANSVGIFDSGYRGYVMVVLDNIKNVPYEIKRGDRLVQICSGDLTEFDFKIVDELSESKRGEGGFGSTGR